MGIVNSGGVAGFPLPVLRYFVRPGTKVSPGEPAIATPTVPQTLALLQPAANAQLAANQPITFHWHSSDNAKAYKLEITEVNNDALLLSAVLNRETTSYTAPPWLRNSAGKLLQWRVLAISETGTVIQQSDWRKFQL